MYYFLNYNLKKIKITIFVVKLERFCEDMASSAFTTEFMLYYTAIFLQINPVSARALFRQCPEDNC